MYNVFMRTYEQEYRKQAQRLEQHLEHRQAFTGKAYPEMKAQVSKLILDLQGCSNVKSQRIAIKHRIAALSTKVWIID